MAESKTMTVETAERLLGSVPFLDRLQLGLMLKKGGASSVAVRSYEEFIKVCKALNPVVSAEMFCSWIGATLGDAELVAEVAAACEGIPLFGQRRAILPLVEKRVAEAHEVLGDLEEEAQAESA